MKRLAAALALASCTLLAGADALPRAQGRQILRPMGFRGVTLGDGTLRRQVDATAQFYLRIPNDDLLKGFRRRAGRSAPGAEMGGWYSDDVFHVFGQILSGLARLHAASGDPAPRAKLNTLIHEWGECVERDGYFYASRTPNATHYTYDKMVGGLVDAMVYAGNREARGLLRRITDWAVTHLVRGRPYAGGAIDTEWYTLTENLNRAWLATGDSLFRDFARVWEYSDYWAVYAAGGDIHAPRPGGARTAAYHAYSHVNTLNGAASAYHVTGDSARLRVLRHAYDYLQEHQCYATGGYGPDEQLLADVDRRAHSLATHNSFETQCGSWAGFKLGKSLISFTGDARYGDWIEALVLNGIGASLPPADDGRVFYYADYNPVGAAKRLNPTPWTCCTGTRPMAVADYCDLIYFAAPGGVCVNLYANSSLRWNQAGASVTLRQRTRFPEAEIASFEVTASRPVRFVLRLRAPGWLAAPAGVRVNGRRVPAARDAHGWIAVGRKWQTGDRLEVRLPMGFRAAPLDGLQPYPVALMYGPVTLAFRSERPLDPRRVIGRPRALAPAEGEPLTWRLRADPSVLVRPFYAVREGEPYAIYLDPAAQSRIPVSAGRWGGAWQQGTQFRYTDAVGAWVEFDFVGTGFVWSGSRFDDAGIAEVRVDAEDAVRVDQFGPGRDLPFGWRREGLTRGRHTVRITLLPERVAGSTGRYINVAGIEALGNDDATRGDRQ